MMPSSALIVGIGNIFMGDEGLGIHVLERLQSSDLPDNVSLIQCDTDLLSMESSYDGQPLIIIIDAIRMGDRPGTIHSIREPEFQQFERRIASAHHISAIQSAMLLKRLCPQFKDSEFIILGIEPLDITFSHALSPPVQAAVGVLLECIRELLHI